MTTDARARAAALLQRLQAVTAGTEWTDEGAAGEAWWLQETAANVVWTLDNPQHPGTGAVARDVQIGSCSHCEHYAAEHHELNAMAEAAGLL